MPVYGSTERHPLISLILLLLLILAGLFVFTLIGIIAGGILYGSQDLLKFFSGDFSNNLNLTKLIQIVSAIGMFIVPALFFARLESVNWMRYLKFNSASPLLFLLVVLLMFSSTPMLELSVEVNQNMKLPSFMQDLETWMRNQEDHLAELTKQLLKMNSATTLAVNLLMLAVLPAIGEELIFRGSLQKIFTKMIANYHFAIWITAIIFSAFHMQFYGFLPRMLLGAMFGYLLVWSNSIWIPILAHFTNNAIAVMSAYLYQQQGLSLEKINESQSFSPVFYLASLILTAVLLWFFYNQSKRSILTENTNGTGLD
ncbi:CPBP family intramembrane glutamic endopeptidase [Daejeonella oryzae]|uniref:CPBP family intramembrane glutamic endopeptidase n=1 Tax=Daejeonella oryzae TaxID=1122943 RepID=UPI00040537E6|nr:CPBP family intramembrane glutamic endopeptidase [Daejeonella oryzae]